MCIALHDVGFHAQLPGQRKVSCPLLAHHLKYPGSQIFLSNASGFIARGMVDNDELEAFGNELGDQHLEKLRFIARSDDCQCGRAPGHGAVLDALVAIPLPSTMS